MLGISVARHRTTRLYLLSSRVPSFPQYASLLPTEMSGHDPPQHPQSDCLPITPWASHQNLYFLAMKQAGLTAVRIRAPTRIGKTVYTFCTANPMYGRALVVRAVVSE